MSFLDNTGLTHLVEKLLALLSGKVDKEDGKGLSANDFTAAYKTKLDGIATGANKYSLPTAGSTLGGVKTTSTVSDASGYTPVPIIGGVPYYKDTNSTYNNAGLGQGYGTCATAEATAAKAAALSGYALTLGGIVAIKFTYAVPASATLNINSKGAKNIFYKGAAITANIIKAGDTVTFIYDGTQYHVISIDRDNNTVYSAATTSAAGLMSAADKTKLDGIATGANNYVHPSGSGSKHIPAGGSSGQILRWSADGTAVWGADNNTTYAAFKAATASAAGGAGLVPTPAAGKQGQFLRGDGTWAAPANTTYAAITTAEIDALFETA